MKKKSTATVYLLKEDEAKLDAIMINRIKKRESFTVTSLFREALEMLYQKELKNMVQ